MAKKKPTPPPQGRKAAQPAPKQPVARQAPTTSPALTLAPGFWGKHWLPALLLTALAFVLYSASIGYGYMLDDEMVIWKNDFVMKGLAGWPDIFAADSFMGYFKEKRFLLEGGRYRPLSLAMFAVEVQFFGKEAHTTVGHFMNILLYGLTGALLYRILLGFFPLQAESKWYFSAAFIGALLFVAHPIHSEAVANIKGRDEILALLLSLGALWATLKYYDRGGALWLVSSGVLLLLGMLAKENALTFVAVIPLTVYFFVKTPPARVWNSLWPALIAAALFIGIRYSALGYMLNPGKTVVDLMNNPFLGMQAGEKYATISLTLAWYLKLLVWPHPLTHDYYPYHVPKVNWTDWRALLGITLHLAMGVWAVWNIKKRSVPAYSVLFYLFTLSIVSNIFISIGAFMNERFVYMPSVAFCLLLGWWLARHLPARLHAAADQPYAVGGILLLLLLGFYGWKTLTRVPEWKDVMSLNASAVRISEGSCRSHTFYVTAIYENIYLPLKTKEEKAPWVDTMEYHIRRSLQINPNYGAALVMNAAVAAARFEQDIQMDKLFNEFDYCLDRIPFNNNLRNFVVQYLEYLAKSGGNPQKISSFAYRNGYERFYLQKKDPQMAIRILEAALVNQTEDSRVLDALAEIYQAANDPGKAAEMKARADANR